MKISVTCIATAEDDTKDGMMIAKLKDLGFKENGIGDTGRRYILVGGVVDEGELRDIIAKIRPEE